jgi:hypothetical protein
VLESSRFLVSFIHSLIRPATGGLNDGDSADRLTDAVCSESAMDSRWVLARMKIGRGRVRTPAAELDHFDPKRAKLRDFRRAEE